MAVGKRSSVAAPLTEHDVAERLDRAAVRLWNILLDIRENQGEDFMRAVQESRYHSNALRELRKEIDLWLAGGYEIGTDLEPSATI